MFATVFLLLLTCHWLADYPGQTDRQASRKAGWTDENGHHHHGWYENLVHAATHVGITAVVLLLAGWLALGQHPSAVGLAAGLAWVGISHSLIDRRRGVRWWMENTGQQDFLAHGGAAHVDQAAHVGLGLLPAALLIALL
ncbi:DUF3307 domain-containing protein [Kitasatospora sp. NPDC001261]|uniref:DUF3307 domain-containing protein n=1 Tax=Kitasatospora sp. NPDC001261 TaxID=3364012 RepID=UPI00368AA73B